MQQPEQKERLILKQDINNNNNNNNNPFDPSAAPASSAPSWTKDKKVLYSKNDTSTSSKANTSAKRAPTDQVSSEILNETASTSLFKTQNGSGHRQRREEAPSDRQTSSSNPTDSSSSHLKSSPQQMNAANNQASNPTTSGSNASTIIGHYQLKRTLGKGNFSTVKLAQHRITQHSVAIKIVKISILSEDNLMKINREIDVLKKIGKHANIVRLYQVIKTKRYFMLVTEYCPNGELYDYLVDKGKLSEPQSCNYFLQILSAVEYLHEHNIVHRDLKAENLLLTEDNKTIKIADFGFANYYKHDKPLSTWCGSPPYAAPELFKGLQYVGPPVDIWSLGVILYVMVCGSLPFDGHNLVYLKSRVLSGKYRIPFFMSTECEGLIRGMLRLDPERRFNVKQIKNSSWISKYNGPVVAKLGPTPEKIVQNVTTNAATSNENTSKMSVASNDAGSIKNLDKNNITNSKNTYQSSKPNDEDDKRKSIASYSNEDSPMLCASGDKSPAKLSPKDIAGAKTSTIHNFVDTEIANAVSNMSLDSNNSAMSVSQSYNTLSNSSAAGLSNCRLSDVSRPETRNGLTKRTSLIKENSIDDQIIDYMVEDLKVADTQSSIRQSIANDKYDDLHAMYKLIRDQPGPLFEAYMSAKFKVPSLPLLSLNKQESNKKPSITTGFFNAPSAAGFPDTASNKAPVDSSVPLKNSESVADDASDRHDGSGRDRNDAKASPMLQNDALNLTSIRQQRSEPARQSDDATWQIPPQLFLTPPSENRVQASEEQANRKGDVETSKQVADANVSPSNSESFNAESNSSTSRQSFDSTLQQLCDISGALLASSNNKLTLSNTAKHCLWDSSILDNLSVSSPSQYRFTAKNENSPNSAMANQDSANADPTQLTQNLVGITTNLPQIGTQQSNAYQTTINQNLYLAQLNSLALSAAVTQSSMLTQTNLGDQKFQAAIPIKFTPNNLMNQNCNVMNNLALQTTINNPCIPNLTLLDPNGLISGFERRASDGQASYSSLTTNADPTTSSADNQKYEQSRLNDNSSFQMGSNSTAAGFLSSSSNQISSDSSRYTQVPNFCSFDASTDIRPRAYHQNDGSNQSQNSEDSMIVSTDEAQQLKEVSPQQRLENSTQMNPLDLTKFSNDASHHEVATQSNNQSRFSQQQQQQHLGKAAGQRSHSTTSDSLVFHHLPMSATTSPRSSLFIPSASNNNTQSPSYQAAPSSLSLTGGGTGHLLNRRKRHSLETESRHHHHYHRHANNQQSGSHHLPYGPNLHLLKNYNDSNRSLRQSNNQQYLHYPMKSHIGQLRNFAQTFTYGKSIKDQNSPSKIGWPETTGPQASNSGANSNNSAADQGNFSFAKSQDCADGKSRI